MHEINHIPFTQTKDAKLVDADQPTPVKFTHEHFTEQMKVIQEPIFKLIAGQMIREARESDTHVGYIKAPRFTFRDRVREYKQRIIDAWSVLRGHSDVIDDDY